MTITHSLTQTVYIKKKTVMPRTSRVNTQLKQLIRIRIKKDPLTSVQFSCSVMSNSVHFHGMQHARLPCPSPTPRAYSNSCPSNWRCHQTISSSVVPFSSHLQSFPASGSFPVVVYGCESWTIKKAECQKLMLLNCGVGEDS